ncbi:MAG TPA: Crp/Fnr family transcriptional regulator [Burkholderiaceae bacterium]|nr:Crp/Fnr family transcriptional regulator [Burkholderiaceae bacterium]
MDFLPDLRDNHLLAALPDPELWRLAPRLHPVPLQPGQVLYESGSTISHAYFPTTALISSLYEFDDGTSAETAITGNEGMIGIAVFMGGESRLGRAVVLTAGHAFRLGAQALKDEFHRTGPLMHLLLHYTQALITQTAQTAVCNRHHSLDQRLCRWLLLSLDRSQGDDFAITQQVIAHMLGVRRESVTEAAHKLQELGLVRCGRGHIVVLDRRGLEKRACECYSAVRKEYDRLLPDRRATQAAALQRATPVGALQPVCSLAH